MFTIKRLSLIARRICVLRRCRGPGAHRGAGSGDDEGQRAQRDRHRRDPDFGSHVKPPGPHIVHRADFSSNSFRYDCHTSACVCVPWP